MKEEQVLEEECFSDDINSRIFELEFKLNSIREQLSFGPKY